MSIDSKEMSEALARPFEADEVKWKAQVVKGNRALAVAYVDARVVAERLDEVFGIDGWQDGYQVLPTNSVICHLRVRVGTEWIEKADVGSPSEQPDAGDRMKSAFSDALKRAAVKFGIGRYLYRLPHVWCDYDPTKKVLTSTPALPEWARPAPAAPQQPEKAAPAPAEAKITREQWNEILDALKESGASQRQLLSQLGVSKPAEVPASKFNDALRMARLSPLTDEKQRQELSALMVKKGWTTKQAWAYVRQPVKDMEEMTVEQFHSLMFALEKSPDQPAPV